MNKYIFKTHINDFEIVIYATTDEEAYAQIENTFLMPYDKIFYLDDVLEVTQKNKIHFLEVTQESIIHLISGILKENKMLFSFEKQNLISIDGTNITIEVEE